MTYDDYAAACRAFRDYPTPRRIRAFRHLPELADSGPLSDWERGMAEKQIREHTGTRPWLAVAEPGLRVGDLIVPDEEDGATFLSITDVPYVAETAFEAIRQTGPAGIYAVEPQGPVTVDPPAFRLGLYCVLDRTMDQDCTAHSEAMIEAACCYRCEAARMVQVLEMPKETGAKH